MLLASKYKMIYQYEEIELTLKLSYFAKIHLRELENILQIDNDRKYNQDYIFYSYIVYIVDFWLNSLFPDEQKIIFLRYLRRKHMIVLQLKQVIQIIVLLYENIKK